MSKSAVTAGLIGGRVGNKGGVGISLNIDGTTLLFLNAHLAGKERVYIEHSSTKEDYSPRRENASQTSQSGQNQGLVQAHSHDHYL